MQLRACFTALLPWTTKNTAIHSHAPALSSISQSLSNDKFLDPNDEYLKKPRTPNQLPTSKPGLDPSSNRFHQPIVYHPNYSFPSWPTNHTFPMSKFFHTAQILLQKLPHLPRPLVRSPDDFYTPLDTNDMPYSWIGKPLGPIDKNYLESFLSSSLTYEEQRTIGFRELCNHPELIKRTLLEVSGTILTCHLAFVYGLATNVAGGTHHAKQDMGAGYTILNDLAIGSNYILNERLNCGLIKGVKRVLVIDCDVHQGDGTASFKLFEHDHDEPKREMFTFSIHCESNYPTCKAKSTVDIGLPDDTGDEEYLDALIENVNIALQEIKPDFVFYDAGVDVYEHDVLGRLKITEEGIRRRDRWVIERCVSDGIPVAGVIGGGYDKDVVALAKRHAILHEEASYVWRKYKMWTKSPAIIPLSK